MSASKKQRGCSSLRSCEEPRSPISLLFLWNSLCSELVDQNVRRSKSICTRNCSRGLQGVVMYDRISRTRNLFSSSLGWSLACDTEEFCLACFEQRLEHSTITYSWWRCSRSNESRKYGTRKFLVPNRLKNWRVKLDNFCQGSYWENIDFVNKKRSISPYICINIYLHPPLQKLRGEQML